MVNDTVQLAKLTRTSIDRAKDKSHSFSPVSQKEGRILILLSFFVLLAWEDAIQPSNIWISELCEQFSADSAGNWDNYGDGVDTFMMGVVFLPVMMVMGEGNCFNVCISFLSLLLLWSKKCWRRLGPHQQRLEWVHNWLAEITVQEIALNLQQAPAASCGQGKKPTV